MRRDGARGRRLRLQATLTDDVEAIAAIDQDKSEANRLRGQANA